MKIICVDKNDLMIMVEEWLNSYFLISSVEVVSIETDDDEWFNIEINDKKTGGEEP